MSEENIMENDFSEKSRLRTLKEGYLSFSGRLNRKKFILRSLFLGLMMILIMIFVGLSAAIGNSLNLFGVDTITLLLTFRLFIQILGLIFLVFSISLNARRLHDVGVSAKWMIAIFVINIFMNPYFYSNYMCRMIIVGLSLFLNLFLIYVYFFRKGTRGANEYGKDPLEFPETSKKLGKIELKLIISFIVLDLLLFGVNMLVSKI